MKKILSVIVIGMVLGACAEHVQSECVYPSCYGSQYTVREPVETIYKNTTYTTVYEPKTYTTTSYTRCKY